MITSLLEKGYISIEDNVKFKYHTEILKLFGKDYKAHMKATYLPNEEWCVWFPKLYPNGDWHNKLLDDGKLVVMERKHEGVLLEKHMIFPDDEPGERIIFAHVNNPMNNEKYYKFIGVFTELEGDYQRASCSLTSSVLYFDGKGNFSTNPMLLQGTE